MRCHCPPAPNSGGEYVGGGSCGSGRTLGTPRGCTSLGTGQRLSEEYSPPELGVWGQWPACGTMHLPRAFASALPTPLLLINRSLFTLSPCHLVTLSSP